jgi:hypothetical protein
MHRRVFSVHFRKDESLHACAIGGLFLSSSRSSVDMWRLRYGFLSSQLCSYVEASLGFSWQLLLRSFILK